MMLMLKLFKLNNIQIVSRFISKQWILLIGPSYGALKVVPIHKDIPPKLNLPKEISTGTLVANIRIDSNEGMKVILCQYLAPGTKVWMIQYDQKMLPKNWHIVFKSSSNYISPPVSSFDGSKWAFLTNSRKRDNLYNLCIYDFKRKQVKLIYETEINWNFGLYYRLSFTPDGNYILMSVGDKKRPKVVKIHIETKSIHYLDFGINPQWQPFGNKILYAEGNFYSQEKDFILFDTKTQQKEKIIDKAIDATWSPDGQFIAFSRNIKKFDYIWEIFKLNFYCNNIMRIYLLSIKNNKEIGPIITTNHAFFLTWLKK